MKTTKKTQIETLLTGVLNLNDFNSNDGAINYLDTIYVGFVSSLECEEMEGRDRANITFFFLKLKKLIESSKDLTEQDIKKLKYEENEITLN